MGGSYCPSGGARLVSESVFTACHRTPMTKRRVAGAAGAGSGDTTPADIDPAFARFVAGSRRRRAAGPLVYAPAAAPRCSLRLHSAPLVVLVWRGGRVHGTARAGLWLWSRVPRHVRCLRRLACPAARSPCWAGCPCSAVRWRDCWSIVVAAPSARSTHPLCNADVARPPARHAGAWRGWIRVVHCVTCPALARSNPVLISPRCSGTTRAIRSL